MADFDELIREAAARPGGGWDFSWMEGRASGSAPSWSYESMARDLVRSSARLLDVDTGGGEFLAGLAPLPDGSRATEGWAPNVPIAASRLAPLGVAVVASADGLLPFDDASFDLVLNRHGRLDAGETARALHSGGRLLTQQVGSDDSEELNAALGAERGHEAGSWTLERAVAQVESSGLHIEEAREEWPPLTFFDIGAVVLQLRAVAWQIPDFTVDRYEEPLLALHARIERDGSFTVRSHRFLVLASRP
ncbi:class I SAM-dependent methyltransferase [Frondihabitans australicus]|uniref:Methyltransferase family protein n=1 Tax=Frondihabitans australicus TaxID=386892 RepID=A0A495IFW8_9MICO|nr:SAM-dependent methyltransferase [Frondihabitans australicus]RKR74231.1 hypothetical protein C8E83_1340 [Frondihabitans australicus]